MKSCLARTSFSGRCQDPTILLNVIEGGDLTARQPCCCGLHCRPLPLVEVEGSEGLYHLSTGHLEVDNLTEGSTNTPPTPTQIPKAENRTQRIREPGWVYRVGKRLCRSTCVTAPIPSVTFSPQSLPDDSQGPLVAAIWARSAGGRQRQPQQRPHAQVRLCDPP